MVLGRAWVVAGLVFAAVALPRVAHADAVMGPPKDCPVGARGQTSHNGPWCAPTTCADDTKCPSGEVCREQALCVATETVPSRSGWSWGKPITLSTAYGTCDKGAACAKGTCEVALRCVARAQAIKSGKGCVVAEGDASGSFVAVLAVGLFAAAAAARRARRRAEVSASPRR